MNEIFGHFITDSDLNIGFEVIAAAWIHDNYAYFENSEP